MSLYGNSIFGIDNYGQYKNTLSHIKVYDKKDSSFENVIYIIKDIIDANHKQSLNGEQVLSIDIPYTDKIDTEYYIEYNNYIYIVRKIYEIRNNRGNAIRLECEGLYSELIDSIVTVLPDDPILLSGDLTTVLNRIIYGTGWTIVAEDYGSWDIEMQNVYESSVLEAINYVISNWKIEGIELEFDMDRNIYVRQRGEITNVQINKLNLNEIQRVKDTNTLYTRLSVFGNDSLEITGLSVVGFTTEELEGFHHDGIVITENYVDAATINDYARPKHGTKTFDNIYTKETLFEKMKEIRKTLGIQKVSFNVSYVNLHSLGVKFSEIKLGDTITIIDELLGNFNVRVVEISENPFKFELCQITLSTLKDDIVNYLSQVKTLKNSFESYKNTNSTNLSLLNSELSDIADILNGSGSQTVYNQEMIKSFNITNPEKYLKISNGVLGITTDNGTTVKTAIDSDGVYADTLIGNVVMGNNGLFNNISIYQDVNNLTSPLLQLGKINNSYGFQINNTSGQNVFNTGLDGNLTIAGTLKADSLFVKHSGNYVNILDAYNNINGSYINAKGINVKNNSGQTTFAVDNNGNVSLQGSINWSSTNAPTPSQVGINNTYIDADGLYTGTITADKINGGTISGIMLQTASTGKRVQISTSSYSGYINFKDTNDADHAYLYLDNTNNLVLRNTGGGMNITSINGLLELSTSTSGNISIHAADGYSTNFYGNVNFSNATISGFTPVWT